MTMVIVIAGSRLKVAQKIAVPTVLMTNLEPTHGQPIKVLICIPYRITSSVSEANTAMAAPLIPMLGIKITFPTTFTQAAVHWLLVLSAWRSQEVSNISMKLFRKASNSSQAK